MHTPNPQVRRRRVLAHLVAAVVSVALVVPAGVADALVPAVDVLGRADVGPADVVGPAGRVVTDTAAGVVDAVDAAGAAAEPVVDVTERVGVAVCDGFALLPVDGVELCTHGEDDLAHGATGTDAPGSPLATRAPACIGSGSDGQRVEVLHVRRRGTAAPTTTLVRDVRRWVAQVEWTVARSAERFGGQRQVRWLTTTSCTVRVRPVEVGADAMGDFATQISELRAQGFSRRDRTYLLFTAADRYCGIATAPRDDRASSNRADVTTGYARVDRPCWATGDAGYHSIAAHELLHTLGAVQASAPNATPGAHCTDEHDLLCYADGTGGAMRTVCRDGDDRTAGAGDAHDRLLDCRGDDYFHPAPRAGSYLATHWNTADSARLHDPAAPPPPDGEDRAADDGRDDEPDSVSREHVETAGGIASDLVALVVRLAAL